MKKINVPERELPKINYNFRRNLIGRLLRIVWEFDRGFRFISPLKKSATFFGGTHFSEDSHYYKEARKLGGLLSERGYTIVSGGGPGIMEAANRGAFERKGESIGINIKLPRGQRANPYLTRTIGFHYFFVRKMMLSFCSSHYFFFPGGYGTLDEFFEIIVLIQTGKLDRTVTVTLIGEEFWQPLLRWFQDDLLPRGVIRPEDLCSFNLVNSAEEALKMVGEEKI